jgi:hypothetical protein
VFVGFLIPTVTLVVVLPVTLAKSIESRVVAKVRYNASAKAIGQVNVTDIAPPAAMVTVAPSTVCINAGEILLPITASLSIPSAGIRMPRPGV